MAAFFTWGQYQYWPEDEPGNVFLARAVDRVGKWLHGEQWSGTEPQMAPTILPALSEKATFSEQEHARDLLAEFRPDMGEPEFEAKNGRFAARYIFTDSLWSTVAYLSKLWSEHKRFRAVKFELRKLAMTGSLPTYWKDDEGDFQEIKKGLWSTDRFNGWSSTCQLAQEDPAFARVQHLSLRSTGFSFTEQTSGVVGQAQATDPGKTQRSRTPRLQELVSFGNCGFPRATNNDPR